MDNAPGQDSPPAEAPRRLRVGWVAGPTSLMDLARTLQPLAVGLLDELVNITVFCPQQADAGQLPCPPLEVVRHGRALWLCFRTEVLDVLTAEIRNRKIELLHALDAEAASMTDLLARRTHLPWVLSSYCPRDAYRLGRRRSRAAGILAASSAVRTAMLACRHAEANRVPLVRPGVYLARGATCFIEPQYSISIVAGGPLNDYAAFDAVLRTYAALHERQYDVSSFLIGDGRAEQRLRDRAAELDIRRDVTFVPSRKPEQLSGIYKAADVYISPTPSECVNLQALMAMAAGVPVLTVQDAVSDFLIGGRTVQVFPRGDAADLTAKLTSWIDDHSAASAMAEAALEHLREHHSPARMVSAVAEAYRSVV